MNPPNITNKMNKYTLQVGQQVLLNVGPLGLEELQQPHTSILGLRGEIRSGQFAQLSSERCDQESSRMITNEPMNEWIKAWYPGCLPLQLRVHEWQSALAEGKRCQKPCR
jgi:hypothetical protein